MLKKVSLKDYGQRLSFISPGHGPKLNRKQLKPLGHLYIGLRVKTPPLAQEIPSLERTLMFDKFYFLFFMT